MGRHGEENGNSRRSRVSFEALRDRVRSLPPEKIERANMLVVRNQLWVIRYAGDFYREWRLRLRGIPYADLRQAAFLGTVKASYTWRESRGAFTYWAWFWMRKEMQALIDEAGPPLYGLFDDFRGNVDLPSPGVSAETLAEATDYADRVRSIVETFPRAHRVAIDDWARGVTGRETAAKLGITSRYLKVLKATALDWLRYRLGEGPEPDRPMREVGTGPHEPLVHAET